MLRNYYVVVDDPEHKDIVHQELLSDSGLNPIPSRSIECVDPMPFSWHNGIFLMTEEEAETLKADPRIRDVHLTPEEQGLTLGHCGVRKGRYDKRSSTTIITNTMTNWGLARCISPVDNFGAVQTLNTYTYTLDGTGVDIILIDTGVEPGHPEFAANADGTGGTRVVDHDWTQYGIITSVPTGGFLGDCEGHGSNCASIAAGNTNGWAPKANIYSLRAIGTGVPIEHSITTGAQLGLVNEILAWQTVRAFHQNKTVDPKTGYKRPTIVSASYQYQLPYQSISSITYRGVTHITNTSSGLYGVIGVPEGGSGTHGVRVPASEAEIASTIAAGVVVVGAAGNDSHKIDVPGGLDYLNYFTDAFSQSFYYHQGGTPGAATGVICVGAIGDVTPDHKMSFSSTGPRVDVFAPGNFIMGAWSNQIYYFASVPDPRNPAYYLNKINGTSQATPQVAGVCALLLQLRPQMTPAEVRDWVIKSAPTKLLNESFYATQGPSYAYISTGTYTNLSSLQGSVGGILYNPFNLPNPITIT